jgi:pSer/pThr/pTyr-binding forkhead associated (FHA) protein
VGLTVGRGSKADIRLTNPQHPVMLSRIHARITYGGNPASFQIEDLQSLNGVFINGKKIAEKTSLVSAGEGGGKRMKRSRSRPWGG